MKGQQNFLIKAPHRNSINCITAVDKKDVVLHWTQDENTNAVTFAAFLQELHQVATENKDIDGGDIIVLCDGAPYHRARKATSMMAELKLRVLFNAAYCPEMNPAEQFIKVHKALLTRQIRSGR